MIESAASLVDTVLPHEPMRQWVLSIPFPLWFLFASNPHVMGKVLRIMCRTIAGLVTASAIHLAGGCIKFLEIELMS